VKCFKNETEKKETIRFAESHCFRSTSYSFSGEEDVVIVVAAVGVEEDMISRIVSDPIGSVL
jgi:hypothetical protein